MRKKLNGLFIWRRYFIYNSKYNFDIKHLSIVRIVCKVITHSSWINNTELALYPVLVEIVEVTPSVSYISMIFEICFKDVIQFQMQSIEKRSYLLSKKANEYDYWMSQSKTNPQHLKEET